MASSQLLFKFSFRRPLLVILSVILGFSGAFFNGVGTALIVPVLLDFIGQEAVIKEGPPIIQTFMSIFDGFSGDTRLIAMMGAVLLAISLKNAANYANELVSGILSRHLVNSLRLEGLKLLLDVDLDFHSKNNLGDIMNRINNEVNRTATAIRTLITIFTNVVTVLVFTAILILLSWQLTVISTGLLLAVALSNQYFISRSKQFGKILSEKAKALTNTTIQDLTGIRLIKAVAKEEDEYQKLEKLVREREKADFQSQANYSAIAPISEVTGIIALLLIIIIGKYLFSQQLQAVSAILLTYLLVLFRLLPFIGQLNGNRSRFANVVPSVEIVADFLRRDRKPFMVNGSVPFKKLENGIRIEGLSFGYPDSDELVLKDINLWLPKGKTLALVGSSGAGKSTLADLLPRFYDPTSGRIFLDGKDLREYDMKTVRGAMGVVSQDTFLFSGSVGYNIAYGQENATEEEIIQAAKRANAFEFIANLPQGFDTEIGDRGILLSGGQRQRIAIARALLRNPDILILDEATSALDTVSERLVQQAIDELCRERTTIVIAHRLSTVQKAHQIAVMEKGRVVELGTHKELLEQGGHYTRLYSMQFEQGSEDVIGTAVSDALVQTSYEVRSHLNPMIGFLQLVVNNIVDTPEERQELTEEAYKSAINLLNNLKFVEENYRELNKKTIAGYQIDEVRQQQ